MVALNIRAKARTYLRSKSSEAKTQKQKQKQKAISSSGHDDRKRMNLAAAENEEFGGDRIAAVFGNLRCNLSQHRDCIKIFLSTNHELVAAGHREDRITGLPDYRITGNLDFVDPRGGDEHQA